MMIFTVQTAVNYLQSPVCGPAGTVLHPGQAVGGQGDLSFCLLTRVMKSSRCKEVKNQALTRDSGALLAVSEGLSLCHDLGDLPAWWAPR